FSEPLDPATVSATTFRLNNITSGASVSVSMSLLDAARTFLLSFSPLAAGQHALIISAAAVKDLDGIAVGAADFTSTFNIVLASIRWTNAAGGSWQVRGNWSGNRVPGPTDDVDIDVPGDVTITYGQVDS